MSTALLIALLLAAVALAVNYFLSYKLYKEPENKSYFNNVKNVNTIKMPEIAPGPKYILYVTLLCGIAMGLFLSLVDLTNEKGIYGFIFVVMVSVIYIIEISRRIKITENSLALSRAFAKTKEIPLEEIKGIYIYSFFKRFMKKHALTTKLVVVTKDKKIKFTISSLSKPAVLNIIKNNFGVTDNKIYVASNK